MSEVYIELRRNWFGPGAISYDAERNGSRLRHRLPVEVAVQAPSDAKVFDMSGKFLGERRDWSQEAEAKQQSTEELRKAVIAARKKSTDAATSVVAAEAAHKKETDSEKKKLAEGAVNQAKSDAAAAKKELDDANAALEAANEEKPVPVKIV